MSWGKQLQGNGEGTQVLPGCDLVCSSPRTCPGELISSLEWWGVPNGPSSLLSRMEHAQGSQLLRWYQSLLSLVTGGETSPAVLKKLLLQHKSCQLWGTREEGKWADWTWEWDTSWCVVSFSINCNKAKTETWQWFCSRDAAAGCSVLSLLQLVSTEQLLRMSGTSNHPFVCCFLPVGLCHLSNLQETALPGL